MVGNNSREGAEIIYGAENCYRNSIKLMEELGFPKGCLPLKDLEECGLVKETGFFWMKQKCPYEHFFEKTNTRVSYAAEVTGFLEKLRMKKVTGIKSKQMFLWVPIVEMSVIEEDDDDPAKNKLSVKTPMGIGKSFNFSDFMTEEEIKN